MFEIKILKTDDKRTKKIKQYFIKLQKQFDQMEREIEEAQRVEGELMHSIIY